MDKQLLSTIFYFLNSQGNKNLLELGCGNGKKTKHLSHYFTHIHAIDKNISIWQRITAKQNITFLKRDINTLQLIKQFDNILFLNSMHFLDIKTILIKSKKWLAPDGRILIIEPTPKSRFYDSRLNQSSKEFNNALYKAKVSRLKACEHFLNKQKTFSCTQKGVIKRTHQAYWLLEHKKN